MSFNNDDGLYKPVSSAGDDGYSVLRRPVTFDADVEPMFHTAPVMDEDEERRLDYNNKLWFEERVARLDEDDLFFKLHESGAPHSNWNPVPMGP